MIIKGNKAEQNFIMRRMIIHIKKVHIWKIKSRHLEVGKDFGDGKIIG